MIIHGFVLVKKITNTCHTFLSQLCPLYEIINMSVKCLCDHFLFSLVGMQTSKVITDVGKDTYN